MILISIIDCNLTQAERHVHILAAKLLAGHMTGGGFPSYEPGATQGGSKVYINSAFILLCVTQTSDRSVAPVLITRVSVLCVI